MLEINVVQKYMLRVLCAALFVLRPRSNTRERVSAFADGFIVSWGGCLRKMAVTINCVPYNS